MSISQRLTELGITLPAAPAPVANYIGCVVAGELVVVSGQLPIRDGALLASGKLGATVTLEDGKAAARQCFINILAQLNAACDLDRIVVVRLGGFIACTPDFTQHAGVMNGASDLAVEVFGPAGKHARTTIGVPSLPLDAAVEVEGLFRIV
jgi:enamine deaminase RidA (YjgF/YER057c/UK114 family)